MPTTRSQIKVSSNSEFKSNQNEIKVSIKTDNCMVCKKKYETWFKEEKFNIKDTCPCILRVCEHCSKCSDESEEVEYCPLDIHDSAIHYVESVYPEANKETMPSDLNEIPLIIYLNEKPIRCCYEDSDRVLECIDGAQEEENLDSPVLIASNKIRSEPTKWKYIIATAILAAAVSVVCYFLIGKDQNQSPLDSNSNTITTTEMKIEEVFQNLTNLENKYSNHSKDLWATLRLGMRKLLKQDGSPTTILLLHSQNSTADTCFLRDIKRIATDIALFQQKESPPSEVALKPKGVLIDMEHNRDIFDNPGEFMERYKVQLQQDKLMIVLNFHKSPMTVMEAFHFLSDTIDPWVENVLIILTLEIKIPFAGKNYEGIAEDELRELLKTLPDNVSDPLITRLTENVYRVEEKKVDSMWSSSSCSLF